MLTVTELLSHPVFKNFRLASDRSGLNNRVRDSGIFEWETGDSLDESFHPGDFIITTLSPYRDMPDAIEPVLLALLEKNLAALCIKDVYFKTIPPSVIEYANALHIPVFLFSETYFDDIIYTIKSSLDSGAVNLAAVKNARRLIYDNPAELEAEMLSKEINPYLHSHVICGCWLPRDKTQVEAVVEKYTEIYNKYVTTVNSPSQAAYSVIIFPRGVITIYSDSRGRAPLEEGLISLSKELELDTRIFSMGISRSYSSLLNLGDIMKESVYAATISGIENTPRSFYNKIGIAKLLCPLRNSYWMQDYLNDNINLLKTYDQEHNSGLLNTLEEYVNCSGDINKTAEKTFQHGNTIRYRLDKIMEILNISDSPDRKSQLEIIIKLYQITNAMKNIRL